jgi:hypothetical protein
MTREFEPSAGPHAPQRAAALGAVLQNLPPVDVSSDSWDNYLLSMAQVVTAENIFLCYPPPYICRGE